MRSARNPWRVWRAPSPHTRTPRPVRADRPPGEPPRPSGRHPAVRAVAAGLDRVAADAATPGPCPESPAQSAERAARVLSDPHVRGVVAQRQPRGDPPSVSYTHLTLPT